MRRLDPFSLVLGRRPSPYDLCRMYAFPGAVPMIYNPPSRHNTVVVLIRYEPKYSAHPVAVYDSEGRLRRLPTNGLITSTWTDSPFPYEIQSHKALRTARDPRDLAEQWALENLNQPLPNQL